MNILEANLWALVATAANTDKKPVYALEDIVPGFKTTSKGNEMTKRDKNSGLNEGEGIRGSKPPRQASRTLRCGECGGLSVPMEGKFLQGKLLNRQLFWRKCKECSLVSEAVPRKKKSLGKWNTLATLVLELKKRKWTA